MARGNQSEISSDTRVKRVRVRAGTLLAGLKDVAAAVEARNTVPILGNVLLAVSQGGTAISLTGTDLDLWVMRELVCEAQDAHEQRFALTLPGKALLAVIGEFDPDAMVTVTGPGEGETRATIAAGRSRFRLPVLPAADFPPVPPLQVAASLDLRCSALADAFAAVEHAISTEETRYYLNGIYVHCDQTDLSLRFATTDGHRLARLSLPDLEGASAWPAMILARKTVGLLDKLLAAAAKTTDGKDTTPAQVLLEAGGTAPGSLVRFALPAADGGSVELMAKTIDGTFPDYIRVIPSSVERTARIAREPLAAAIKRVAVLAADKTRSVKAEFSNDLLTLTVSSAELGEATEELPCSYDAAELTIGFDAKYWRDALGALACENVAMGMTDGQGPARIRAVEGDDGSESERLVQVLMPVRV